MVLQRYRARWLPSHLFQTSAIRWNGLWKGLMAGGQTWPRHLKLSILQHRLSITLPKASVQSSPEKILQNEKLQHSFQLAESTLTGGYLHSMYFWVSVVGLGVRDAMQNLRWKKEQLLREALENLKRLEDLQEYVSAEHLAYNRTVSNSLNRLRDLSFHLTMKLKERDPQKLLVGADHLAYVQQKHKWYREGIRKRVYMSQEVLLELDQLMQFSAASYGYKMLHFFGLAKRGMNSNKNGISLLTGVEEKDILVLEEGSKLFRPGHFVCVDHASKRVVVVVRGTIRLQDVVTDLICDDAPFRVPGANGRVHEGFLRAAQTLAVELLDPVRDALDLHQGYSLVICGHSMGGAVSSLLALIWGQTKAFRLRNVKGVSFASPCCMSLELARSDYVKQMVTSIVLGDDFICRLSLSNVELMLKCCDELSRNTHLSCVEKYSLIEKLRREAHNRDDRMFPAGLVYSMPLQHRYLPNQYDVLLAEEIDPAFTLGEIILSPKMLDVHLPSRYLNAIRMQHRLHATVMQ